MGTSSASLDDLRRRIDEIDDRLHDLIMQRAALVEDVAAVKRQGNTLPMRPGREATILRRLVARHRGPFSRRTLIRIWRELISGATELQGEFTVAVPLLEDTPDYWDLARDHFGGHAPMIAYHSVGEVLRALAEGRADVGVMPMPAEGERQPWWPLLAVGGAAAPHVLARLPFAGRGNARGGGGHDALAIGHGDADPSGEDRSLIALETQGEPSRARLIDALQSAGLTVTLLALHEPSGGIAWSLVEIDDMVPAADPRLEAALRTLGEQVTRVVHLGSYAKPIPAAALDGEAAR